MNFELILPQRIIFGEGTSKQVGEQAKRLCGKQALIITSSGMRKRECLNQITDSLWDYRIVSRIFSEVNPDPPAEDMLACVTFAKETLWDFIVGKEGGIIIGLGGGSVMDVAKKVATVLNLPKIMMPTTAGSGSEVTHDAVFKIDGKKRGYADKNLVADVAIVDPDLLKTLPHRKMVASAIDALAHSIESYYAKRGNMLTKSLSYKASGLMQYGLSWWVTSFQDVRTDLSLGSLMAGMAFGNSGTTLCHALSYPLSNRGIPHSEAVAIMLPYSIEFNGYENELNGKLIDKLKAMVSKFKFGKNFNGDIEEMAKEVMEDERHLSNNPKEVRLEDVVKIYREALECVAKK